MERFLIATAALLAATTTATADISISGYGRFGLDYNDANARFGDTNTFGLPGNGSSKFNLISRLRLNFDMSTESDAGVTLGARIRAQASSTDGDPQSGKLGAARLYASYGGFTVAVGNILGALDETPGLSISSKWGSKGFSSMHKVHYVTNVNDNIGGPGPGDGEYGNWDSFSSRGSGANGVEAIYSAGPFGGHISHSRQNDEAPGIAGARRSAAHISWKWENWTVALAGQDSNKEWEDKVFFAVQGKFDRYGVKLAYADNNGIDKYGLYGSMDVGAASNMVLWVTHEGKVKAGDVANGRHDNRRSVNPDGTAGTAFGMNYGYDLGGGASFLAGAQHLPNSQTQVQAGVRFDF